MVVVVACGGFSGCLLLLWRKFFLTKKSGAVSNRIRLVISILVDTISFCLAPFAESIYSSPSIQQAILLEVFAC